MKKLLTLFINPKVLLTFGGVLFAIAGLDMWMRGCNDINIWNCMSWIGKSCATIDFAGVFGFAIFWIVRMAVNSIHTPRKKI